MARYLADRQGVAGGDYADHLSREAARKWGVDWHVWELVLFDGLHLTHDQVRDMSASDYLQACAVRDVILALRERAKAEREA